LFFCKRPIPQRISTTTLKKCEKRAIFAEQQLVLSPIKDSRSLRANLLSGEEIGMNTNAVAKLLGVSPSTIQRWVKQANLKMDRNELGHYVFSEDSIEVLRKIQVQVNNGVLLQDIAAATKIKRQAVIKTDSHPHYEKLETKIAELERKMERKADEIVSYQLLQHRREIEELHDTIHALTERIDMLEDKLSEIPAAETLIAASSEENSFFKRLKKKNFISSFLGF
jgi:chromosome-anchoring protein RacA